MVTFWSRGGLSISPHLECSSSNPMLPAEVLTVHGVSSFPSRWAGCARGRYWDAAECGDGARAGHLSPIG
jgi:hypothetical protein